MARRKKPVPPDSQAQLDREAAVFLLNAMQYSEAIRNGRVSRVILTYDQSLRDTDAKNVSQSTTELKVWLGRGTGSSLPGFSKEEAEALVNKALSELQKS